MIIFICQFCGDERKSKKSLIGHETFCKQNPNHKLQNTEPARKAAAIKINCKYCDKKFEKSNLSIHQETCIENKQNQKHCLNCKIIIHKNKKFCGSSCAASHNNKLRGNRSEKTKEKISNSLKERTYSHRSKKICKIQFKNCTVCDNIFMIKNNYKDVRKTCSRDCQINASVRLRPYQNGSRKTTWYYNKNEDKKVLLESSWEVAVAEKLDDLDIKWIRPDYIKWKDVDNKTRYYFPDFLLIEYDIYLDPKNPYCMKKDKEKMDSISKKVNIIYGDVEYVLEYINNL